MVSFISPLRLQVRSTSPQVDILYLTMAVMTATSQSGASDSYVFIA